MVGFVKRDFANPFRGVIEMKENMEVILSPIVTEKGFSVGADNKYVFKVHLKANKIEIKKAIKEIFKVHVIKVNILRIKGKLKRVRHKLGRTAERKKAIVTLKAGEKIEFV